jgi:ribosomal protein L7/L12
MNLTDFCTNQAKVLAELVDNYNETGEVAEGLTTQEYIQACLAIPQLIQASIALKKEPSPKEELFNKACLVEGIQVPNALKVIALLEDCENPGYTRRKIEAIKEIHHQTGAGLKESKEVVERYLRSIWVADGMAYYG